MNQSNKNPQNYYEEDELLIRDINIDQMHTQQGQTIGAYVVLFVSAKRKEQFSVFMPSESNRWKDLVYFIFGTPDLNDPDDLIGYVVNAKVFYNKALDGNYNMNTSYYDVPECSELVNNFFSQPKPNWSKEQFEDFKRRWVYLDYIKERFNHDLPKWLIEKQKMKDQYTLWNRQ